MRERTCFREIELERDQVSERVCMCVSAEGVKENYVGADLPGVCGSVVFAEYLPHVMRERERDNKLQRDRE